MAELTLKEQHRSFGGSTEFYTHQSKSTKTPMTFSVFRPKEEKNEKVPVLVFLSGLTCNEENFITKSGAQKWASDNGMMIICPDTSPRGTDIPGERDNWDFGQSAGFYLNATTDLWKENYNMYDYVVNEITEILSSNFNANLDHVAISGHSMGGHGALVIGLRNSELFKSVSAFSPICAPMQCPWGQKAFKNYLGDKEESWKQYDASELVKSARVESEILIDQGTDDKFLKEQLKPGIFEQNCKETGYPLNLRMQEGYDHSYYFVSSFIKDHIEFHLHNLNSK